MELGRSLSRNGAMAVPRSPALPLTPPPPLSLPRPSYLPLPTFSLSLPTFISSHVLEHGGKAGWAEAVARRGGGA